MDFKFKIVIIILLFVPLLLNAQQKLAPNIYMVQFTDKNHNTFSLSEPQNFLSSRSQARRIKQNIPIQLNDLPVSPAYLDSIKNAGYTVLNISKWLNAATIQITNDTMLNRLAKMSFIIHNQTMKQLKVPVTRTNSKLNKYFDLDTLSNQELYGSSLQQISINNGQYLHNNKYRGSGMLIAVLDGGFEGALTFSSLQNLWAEQRVILQRDCVDKTGSTFYNLSHGANVLSIMAGYKEGYLVGTAPEASFALIRTEDAHTEPSGLQYEYPVEEFNWVVGAELADSIGTDVINSSLGYSLFNDSSMNHTYKQMDGKTTLCTIGANIASSKGMILVISAGNEGNNSWKYITAPSDAINILTIGAINSSLQVASFSSRGPSSDQRVKPDVAAMGQGIWVQNGTDNFATGSGTSFSAPVISGLAACLWQANSTKTNLEIIDAIRKSSSQYNNPDSSTGYGIPDFQKAYNFLRNNSIASTKYKNQLLTVFPNPCTHSFTIEYHQPLSKHPSLLYITDIRGRIIANLTAQNEKKLVTSMETYALENKPKGMYVLHYQNGAFHNSVLIIKQ